METARSLRTRAVLAVVLMVGYYVFALAIAAALLLVPYLEVKYMERVNGQITFFCVAGALTILWAITPRIDKFAPPGPRLTPSTAPQLFTMIHEVAQATSQTRPDEVYLLSDVNAFVTHRGGFMGFGSRRVMGIGLPLIKGLSPTELRSVIAHEYGHYVSGDVKLGPWIYKTRGAIGRTLQALSAKHQILTAIFNWYARMFMRMTMQISREQEFVADATAARVAGTASTISALKRVEVIAPAYATYIQNEVFPVLRAGFLPPITEGFDQYLSDPGMVETFEGIAKSAIDAETGEFDSHPPMADRVRALQHVKSPTKELAAESALLLKDPDRHARALLEHDFGRASVTKLQAIGWNEVGAKVYAQMWEQQATGNAKWLKTLTADQIPSDKKWFEQKGNAITEHIPEAPAEYRIAFAILAVSGAIGTTMLRQGWAIETAPGKPIVLVKDGVRFDVRESVSKLADGSLPVEEWKARCRSMGIEAAALAKSSS